MLKPNPSQKKVCSVIRLGQLVPDSDTLHAENPYSHAVKRKGLDDLKHYCCLQLRDGQSQRDREAKDDLQKRGSTIKEDLDVALISKPEWPQIYPVSFIV